MTVSQQVVKSVEPTARGSDKGQARAVVAPDWEAIERAYRANRHTLRELQKLYGPSPASILRRVKRYAWQKDLTEPIKSATRQAVLQAVVDEKRRREGIALRLREQGVLESDAEQIAASAAVGANVVLQHRQDTGMMRQMAMRMAEELALAATHPQAIEAMAEMLLIEAEGNADRRGEVKSKLESLLALPGQIRSLERLAGTMARLQQMERAAYDLDRPQETDPRAVAVRAMSDVERVHRLHYLMKQASSRLVAEAE